MRSRDIVRRSGRSLRSAKVRTILTALAISVGAVTLTLTLAASNGLREYTDKLVASNFDPAELLVGRDPEISNNGPPDSAPKEYDPSVGTIQAGGPNGGLQVKRVTDADVRELRNKSYIEQVRENFQISVRYVTREGQKQYTGSIEAFNPAQKPELLAGELPESGDITAGRIVMPEAYVELLGFTDAADAVGKQLTINLQQPFSEAGLQALLGTLQQGADAGALAEQAAPQNKDVNFTISAVSKASSLSFSVGTPPLLINADDARTLYDFTAQGTTDYGKYLFVSARIKDGRNEAAIAAAQADLKENGFYSVGSKDLQQAITQFVDILTIMVGVFGLITVVASVFGIVNTQYISVLERTREIGLMKALGMSRRGISLLFIFEATWIGLLGGVIGSLAGLLFGVVINPVLSEQLNLGEGSSLLVFKPVQMLLLIAALMAVATIAGWLPSRKAAKLDPIEALRTE